MKTCALVWLPFNEISMPPLGIATLTGYLRRKGFDILPFDLNVEFYTEMKKFFIYQPRKIENMFNSWAFNSIFQQAASFLAFPEQIGPPPFLLWEKRAVSLNLETVLRSAAQRIVLKYDIVGISVTNVSFMAAVALSRMIKSVSDQTLIVWGGPSIRSDCGIEKFRQMDNVDLFVEGPGEIPLEKILEQVSKEGKCSLLNKGNIQDRLIRSTGDHPGRKNESIKEICPDFSSFPIQLYDRLTFPVRTSTGCPWSKCKFCCEPGCFYHAMGVGQIDQSLDHIGSVSDRGAVFFVDNCINWDLTRLDKICELMKSKGPRKWTCMARSERLTPSILWKMKSAGCERIFIGLESFSDCTLAGMEKGCSKLDHLHAFRLGREQDIEFAGNFIIGFPGETPEDISENILTLKRYAHLWHNCHFWISSYAATPGSRIFRHPENHGILIHDHGDETQDLPESVSRCVPVWNHHWRYIDEEKNNDKKILKLYHQLETCIQNIQENPSPRRYVKKTWKGLAVFEENHKIKAEAKKQLSRLEGSILKFTSEIVDVTRLNQEMGISPDRIDLILKTMENRGWIARSRNRIVRTIPFYGIKI